MNPFPRSLLATRYLPLATYHLTLATPHLWNYWDYCPRNEDDYNVRLNYLLWNPVKHGFVERIEDYPYSSYHNLRHKKGNSGSCQTFCAISGISKSCFVGSRWG